MLQSIKYNLRNLTNLEGRDARQTFWYYVLFLVVLQFVVSLVAAIPLYISIFTSVYEGMSQGMAEEAATRAMVRDMVGQVRAQTIIGVVLTAISAALILASFVRRLHDAGFSGWIAAIPIATQIFSMVYSISILGEMEDMMLASMENAAAGAVDPMAMQAEMGVYTLVGWIGYLVVIGFGVIKSQDGPNKYGAEPVRY